MASDVDKRLRAVDRMDRTTAAGKLDTEAATDTDDPGSSERRTRRGIYLLPNLITTGASLPVFTPLLLV